MFGKIWTGLGNFMLNPLLEETFFFCQSFLFLQLGMALLIGCWGLTDMGLLTVNYHDQTYMKDHATLGEKSQ